MTRIERAEMLVQIAEVVAKRGTCSRLQVGAVLAKDSRVISTGYNGPPAGMPHCEHSGAEIAGCADAIHAEINALIYAARYGSKTEGATLYVTHQPCLKCAQAIANSGVVEVIYRHPYRIQDGVYLLHSLSIECHQILTDWH